MLGNLVLQGGQPTFSTISHLVDSRAAFGILEIIYSREKRLEELSEMARTHGQLGVIVEDDAVLIDITLQIGGPPPGVQEAQSTPTTVNP